MSTSSHTPTIVVGYDGSNASRAALELAAKRATPQGRVFIVHAFDLPPEMLGWPYYDRILSDRRDHGASLLEALSLDQAPLVGPKYETELIGGPPAQALADVARARNADEIIVGARGLGPVRALLGSVSHELLHLADRPVVVLPDAAVTAQ